MKSITLSLLLAAACGNALAADTAELSEGEIRKVDKDTARLTIKHGELKNLDMPAMTMVFQVKDKAWLDKLKAGDKVRFKAEKEGSAYVVTLIEAQPRAD
jgi:Cu/Ag efflux protein CusF